MLSFNGVFHVIYSSYMIFMYAWHGASDTLLSPSGKCYLFCFQCKKMQNKCIRNWNCILYDMLRQQKYCILLSEQTSAEKHLKVFELFFPLICRRRQSFPKVFVKVFKILAATWLASKSRVASLFQNIETNFHLF